MKKKEVRTSSRATMKMPLWKVTLLKVCQIGCTSLERHDGPLGECFNRELYRPVQFSIQEKLLRSNEKQFRGGLVFKARILLYHSTLGRK